MNSIAFRMISVRSMHLAPVWCFILFTVMLFGSPVFAQTLSVESEFQVKTDTRYGVLTLQFTVPEGWHCFSTTQLPNGPVKSKISVVGKGVKVSGDFVPLDPPVPHEVEGFDVICEQHQGIVIWEAPIELDAGVDPAKVKIAVKYKGQICTDEPGACQLVNEKTTASFVGFVDDLAMPDDVPIIDSVPKLEAKTESARPDHAAIKKEATPKKLELDLYQPKKTHVILTGSIWTDDGAQNFKPGEVVTLEITAVPTEGYHFYAYETTKSRDYIPTLISFKRPAGWEITGPETSVDPIDHDGVFEHDEATTWSFKVKIPADALAGQAVAITGGVQVHTCQLTCDEPSDSQFTVTVPMGTDSAAALKFTEAKMGSVAAAVKAGNFADRENQSTNSLVEKQSVNKSKTVASVSKEGRRDVRPDTLEEIAAMARLYDPGEKIRYLDATDMEANPVGSGGISDVKQTSLGIAMLFAFLGGAILNLMPCVFPVLGIKVMGFVKQGGESTSKVRMHGLVFALGLVVSMWILAGGLLILKNVFDQNIIWGEQMASPYFVGGIIVLLFLLGLNMAGVFEVGTSLTSVGGSISNRGGYGGSFFSGVLTTLIATPCSGPFLGTAMTYALAQSAIISMLMFTVFGLGIALPYVLLSFFPPLIKRLPKPGPWMETFKVLMAFALFATVAWFMQTFGAQTGVDGVSYMLMGLVIVGLAAYFYGSYGEGHIAAGKRWTFGYVVPSLIAVGGFWAVFTGASQLVIADDIVSEVSDGPIPWVTWNPGKVKDSLNNGQIVWVDYTADW